MPYTIPVSQARSLLPQIMEDAYFNDQTIILTRRNIPMIQIKKATQKTLSPVSSINYQDELFGIWKNKQKDAIQISQDLRQSAWNSHAS